MDWVLYILARSALAVIHRLPLITVARLGRALGALAYYLDARHRGVAVRNIAMCFPGKTMPEVRALAKENFRRIGESFACAARTSIMGPEEILEHVTFDAPQLADSASCDCVKRAVVAIGHFGNFELYARLGLYTKGYQLGTTYRGLRQPSLDRLLRSLRVRATCRFFERRSESSALKAFMAEPNVILGLLCDQHAGKSGLELRFLGHLCSTSPAPAVLARRYDCRLFTGFCFRTGLGKWRIEILQEVETHAAETPRPLEEIMLEVNRSLENAVLRDPANWFWVHNRWKRKFSNLGRPDISGFPEPVERGLTTP